MAQRGYICSDCETEAPTFEAISDHVRRRHKREPKCGTTVVVGDIIFHEGRRCRVLELMDNGNLFVQPLPWPKTQLTLEYRIAEKGWQFAIDNPTR